MPNFDLSKYVSVAERVEQFYTEYENQSPRIETELLNVANWEGQQTQFIVRALVYLGEVCLSTGLAEESLGGGGANKLAALENAETSAIGRALANAGYQTSRDGSRQRASREEMEKVGEPGPMQYLVQLLTESGWPKGVQQDIVKIGVGRAVRNLGELTEAEILSAIGAVEAALADEAQLGGSTDGN